MNFRHLTFPALCLACFSCDEAQKIATQVETVAKEQIAVAKEKIAEVTEQTTVETTDPELQKLVDETPEGVLFRKDLPFPGTVSVKITQSNEISGRVSMRSELGNDAKQMKGTLKTVTQQDSAPGKVSYSLMESTFREPLVPDVEAEKQPAAQVIMPPSQKPIAFVKSGAKWKPAVATDFEAVSLADTISPYFDQILQNTGLAPRPLWFGTQRFKVGDKLAVTTKFLPMIVSGEVEGWMDLTFEKTESVGGHPCGVFSVKGDFKGKNLPSFDGTLGSGDFTIQSGKLWLSLIYPLVLKEEYDSIVTSSSGGQGGLVTRLQGSDKATILREWKKVGL